MKQTATSAAYMNAFGIERQNEYPMVDAYENALGYAIDRLELENMALPLACPVKTNPPNWQHGRILYATARAYLAKKPDIPILFLDIGTAKGFSALVLAWALHDHARPGAVASVDVMDPHERVIRNSILECGKGPRTIPEYIDTLGPPGADITFAGGGSLGWLSDALAAKMRVNLAFVDGKHSRITVKNEGEALSYLQRAGDVIVFDDMQIAEVAEGVNMLPRQDYTVSTIEISPARKYGLARRK